MINKKVFALTLIASSVIAAGCSSDDDDDEMDPDTGALVDETTDAVATDAQSTDVNGDGVLDDADDYNMDGFIDQEDVDAYAIDFPDGGEGDGDGDGDGMETPTDPPATATGASVLDLARGTDEDGDGTFEGANPDLSILVALAGAAGLADLLDNEESMLTVFAPTNAAFQAAGIDIDAEGNVFMDADADGVADDEDADGTPDEVDVAGLTPVLQSHVITGTVIDATAAMASLDTDLETASGATVQITQGADGMLQVVDGNEPPANVLSTDSASNGNAVVHAIDKVLMPEIPEAGDTEEGTDGEGTGNGEVTAAGTAQAALEGDANLSEFAALVASTLGTGTLQDSANDGFIVLAPTNGNVGAGADLAYVQRHIINNAALNGMLTAGTYNTTGGTEVTIAGDETSGLTANGVAITPVVTGATGGSVYSMDGDY